MPVPPVPVPPVPVPGEDAVRAVAIACIWLIVREFDSEPIPPILPLIAVWIRARVAPSLEDVARGPWHPAQLLVQSASGVTTVPTVLPVTNARNGAIACSWAK